MARAHCDWRKSADQFVVEMLNVRYERIGTTNLMNRKPTTYKT